MRMVFAPGLISRDIEFDPLRDHFNVILVHNNYNIQITYKITY